MSFYPLNLKKYEREGNKIFPILQLDRLVGLLRFDKEVIINLAKHAGQYYKPFDRKKFGTKKWRHIDNPTGLLKAVQNRIYGNILSRIVLPDNIIGGVKGKSIKDNAAFHIGKNELVTFDIRNCFPSIDNKKIFSIFRSGLGCSSEVATILTQLTTFQTRLPQGASTSLTLANLSLLPIYEEIGPWMKKADFDYSFFVDDIAVSGVNARSCIPVVVRAVQSNGYAISCKKLKIMPSNSHQEVTGVVVNKKEALSRSKINAIRKSIIVLSERQDQITQGDLNSVYGKINYVSTISKVKAAVLEKFAEKLLPAKAKEIRKFKIDETQKCNCAKRHKVDFLKKPQLQNKTIVSRTVE